MDIPEGATHRHDGNDEFNPHYIRVVENNVFARNISGLGIERWVPIKGGFSVDGWTDRKDKYTAAD